ncbi:MAG: tetratricopeptide repeat protein [Rhodospirillales bacterium]
MSSHPACNPADNLHAAGKFAEAIAAYRGVLRSEPNLYRAWYGLGYALYTTGAFADAIAALRRATKIAPNAMPARATLGEALYAIGHVADSNRQYVRIARDGDTTLRQIALGNIACSAPNDPTMDNRAIQQAREAWIAAEAAAIRPLNTPPRPRAGKLRIGYLGAFFGSKNWMKGYMGVLNAHDRARFEVHFIADRTVPSAASGYRDHPDDRIWSVTGVPNDKLASLIAENGIDVLVDLNGYSFQRRLPLLLYKAAPAQFSWVGMYGTTGFAGLDGVIGDAVVAPAAEEKYFSEPIRRMRATYLTFDIFYPVPDVVPPPFVANGFVTFGSLTSAYKITDAVVAAWARIVRGVPDARLLLRNRTLSEPGNRTDFAAWFAAQGIGGDRLILEGGAEHFEFLRTYDRIDIALDAFPYNGGTTTAEAIWQGVPLLSFDGDRWASRTSRSILLAAGLRDFAATDEAGFVATAIRMGLAPEALISQRATQRDRIASTAAFDVTTLCRELETLYEGAFPYIAIN